MMAKFAGTDPVADTAQLDPEYPQLGVCFVVRG
jgi:hypothetical protein